MSRRPSPPAAVTWYELGFRLGVETGNGNAKGTAANRPRLKAMRVHWRQGINDGAIALKIFTGSYAARLRPDSPLENLFPPKDGSQ